MNIPKDGAVINPFSDKFWEIWELYKAYRKEVHNFKFKGVISEQMAIKKVVEVSGGDEDRAIRIVEQTIASGKWMGFYPIKTTTYKENGKQSSTKEPELSLREQAVADLNKRNAERGYEANGSHLKAV